MAKMQIEAGFAVVIHVVYSADTSEFRDFSVINSTSHRRKYCMHSIKQHSMMIIDVSVYNPLILSRLKWQTAAVCF